MMIPTSIFLLLLLIAFDIVIPTEQSTQLSNIYGDSFCLHINGNYTQGSPFQHTLDTVFTALKTNSSSSFYATTLGEGPDQIYGRYFCRRDIPSPDCHACVQTATDRILAQCPTAKEAIVWYEQCTLLYTNSSTRLDDFDLEMPNVRLSDLSTVSDTDQFYPVRAATLNRIIPESAYGNGSEGFATAEANVSRFETLYSLTQCSGDVTGLLCERCLRNALFHADLCCKDLADLAYYYPNCQLRYSVFGPFYGVPNSSAAPISPRAPGVAQSEVHQQPQGNGGVALSCRKLIQIGAMLTVATLILILRN